MSKRASTAEIRTVRADRVRSTSEGFSVYEAVDTETKMPITVKQFSGPVRQLQRWCLAGSLIEDPKWGKQFVAQFAALAAPTSVRELGEFLLSGLVDGWDYPHFAAISRAYPDGNLLDVCANHPEELAAIEEITPEMIQSLQAAWRKGSGMAPIYAQLADWGCNSRQSDALVKFYGFATVDRLTENPYRDLLEISGYGWKTAESVANQLGILANDPRRVQAGIEVAIHEATWQAGHTWLTQCAAIEAAAALLGNPRDSIVAEIDGAIENGHITRCAEAVYPDGRLYPTALYEAEQTIASQVYQRTARGDAPASYEQGAYPSHDDLSGDQWEAVLTALDEPVMLLTGGPGTGKTTTLRTLIACAESVHIPVTCMAPTGKAAARMAEATGHSASTIHSRLFRLAVDLEPVTGLVIVDEVSMLDTQLAATMLSRISMSAQILLVGDPDQLPSVGPGAVLRDLIAADVLPRVHLDHVYRNEAGIAVNAARMRHGEHILSLPDCEILPAATPEHASSLIIDMLALESVAGHPSASTLVLTPTNDGPSGRYALNAALQPLLNQAEAGTGITQYVPSAKDPDGTVHKRSEELRPGDRVMVIRNSSDLAVFNGQTGTVVSVNQPRSLDVDIDGRVITFAGEYKRLLTLAYAITGHKSQGSEAPTVIAPIFPSRVLSREWLYTVITRARERCILVGDVSAIQGCIRIQRANDRRTGLVDALAHHGIG